MRLNRRLTIGLGVALAIAVAGLVVALVALRRDVGELSTAAPHDSVSTAAIEDGAVTADKLAGGSVTAAALAHGAVRGAQLAPGAVTESSVAADSLTGASVRESALAQVPSARDSGDSRELAGLPGSAYLSQVRTVRAESPLDSSGVKGPLGARCPDGLRILSGGASIEGVVYGVAIATSAPRNGDEWVAVARRYRRYGARVAPRRDGDLLERRPLTPRRQVPRRRIRRRHASVTARSSAASAACVTGQRPSWWPQATGSHMRHVRRASSRPPIMPPSRRSWRAPSVARSSGLRTDRTSSSAASRAASTRRATRRPAGVSPSGTARPSVVPARRSTRPAATRRSTSRTVPEWVRPSTRRSASIGCPVR